MQKTGDNVIWFTYDENGLVTGFRYNGSEYFYIKNAQNDVIGICNSSGSIVARYFYDTEYVKETHIIVKYCDSDDQSLWLNQMK